VADERGVLLVCRGHAESPWHGAWCAPGGFCEIGEHPIETAEREAREETGLSITVTGYIGVWIDEYTDEPGRGDAEVINVSYYHAVPSAGRGEPIDSNEVSAVRWFDWDPSKWCIFLMSKLGLAWDLKRTSDQRIAAAREP
jgi:ADP-ribose pyrophosphatase YjhB (NUDIX family)